MNPPQDDLVKEGWLNDEGVVLQRLIVDRQLQSMRAGIVPPHFMAGVKALEFIIPKFRQARLPLLDVGCASGYYSEIFEFMLPGAVDYQGTDFNPAMVRAARSLYPELIFREWDLRRSWEAERFPVVFSGATIMHIREWRQALRNLGDAAIDWLVLHRTWLKIDGSPTTISTGNAYGHCAWYITFGQDELFEILEEADFGPRFCIECGEGGGEDWAVKTWVFRRT